MADKLVTPRRYESGTDVKQRLDGTYIRYRGDVVKVFFYDGLVIKVVPIDPNSLLSSGGVLVDSSSVHLDISSIRLGYLAGLGNKPPVVVRRKPVRRYKQGICTQNMEAVSWYDDETEPAVWHDRDFLSLTADDQFSNMLLDKYPKVSEALTYVKKTSTIPSLHYASISKEFCFVSTKKQEIFLLDIGFEKVGQFNLSTNKLEVNEWWATPTMMDYLRTIGVPLKEI